MYARLVNWAPMDFHLISESSLYCLTKTGVQPNKEREKIKTQKISMQKYNTQIEISGFIKNTEIVIGLLCKSKKNSNSKAHILKQNIKRLLVYLNFKDEVIFSNKLPIKILCSSFFGQTEKRSSRCTEANAWTATGFINAHK